VNHTGVDSLDGPPQDVKSEDALGCRPQPIRVFDEIAMPVSLPPRDPEDLVLPHLESIRRGGVRPVLDESERIARGDRRQPGGNPGGA